MKIILTSLLGLLLSSTVFADTKPITFDGMKFKVNGEEVKWVGNAKNSSSVRINGRLCLRFLDQDGFVVKEKYDSLKFGSNEEKAFNGFTFVSDIEAVMKVTVRHSRHGCLTDVEVHSETYEFEIK